MNRLRIWDRLAAFACLLAIVGGCESAPRTGGPIDQDEGAGELCMPAQAGQPVTVGLDVLQNSGLIDVVIDRVELAEGSEGLALVGALVVPVDSETVGMQPTFPPDLSSISGGEYREVSSDSDAEVPPAELSHSSWNLVVGIELMEGRDVGIATGLNVFYRVGETEYVHLTSNSINLRSDSCEPASGS